jgi:DNA repair protein RadC
MRDSRGRATQQPQATDRPRERLLELGPGALSDCDLVAVLLGTGGDGETVFDLAERVARSVNLRLLPRVPAEDLLAIRGLGPARVAQLLAAAELGRRLWPDGEAATLVRGPETVFDLTRDIRGANREHFVGFYLNTRNQVLRREVISIGSLNASIVHPREVFTPAIALSAANLILAHNHPSGDPSPSEEDLAITRRLVDAGRLLGIDVLDHVIVCRDQYASFRERRLLRT